MVGPYEGLIDPEYQSFYHTRESRQRSGPKIERNRNIPSFRIRYLRRRQTTPYGGEEVYQRPPPIANIVNAKAINLDDAPKGYAKQDKGIVAKFALDQRGLLAKAVSLS